METHQIYDRLENMAFSRLGLIRRAQVWHQVEEDMRRAMLAFAAPAELFSKASDSTMTSFASMSGLLAGSLNFPGGRHG